MSYFGVSTRNGVGLGLGTVPSLTNTPLGYRLAPSLDLSFAGSDALSPAITFSRTTNATLTNSAGLVAYAPMNLLTYSEQFDNAAWTKGNATIAANSVVAPNGTTTADTLTGDGVSAQHYVLQGMATTGIRTISVYAKAGTHNLFQILTAGSANPVANFDLVNGTANMVGSGATASITSAGNGWYRCVLSSPDATATNVYLALVTSLASGRFEANTISGSVYFWGAQLELGSTATTYNPTTVKNLLGFTENFDNAAWTKSNASISATKVDDIYGQPFAQKLVENTATDSHHVFQNFTFAANSVTTASIYVKAGERSALNCICAGPTATGGFFDLVSETATVLAPGIGGNTASNATITPVGNGWYRCSVVLTMGSVSSTTVRWYLSNSSTPALVPTYAGDGTSGIYIFGAQLSDSASVDPYVYQPVAAPSSVAYYGPRFDYDPVTLAPKGLLIEEQRSNLLLNSATLSTQVVTVAATAHTLSFYGTGTIVLSGASTGTVVGTGAYPARATLTFTPTVGVLTLTVTGSVTMAQLEAGAFATSYIPTVASQVTRAADNASMIGNNFARWYNVNEGSVFASFIPSQNSNTPVAWGQSTTDTSGGYFTSVFNHWNGATSIGNTGSITIGQSNKTVVAYTGTSSRAAVANASSVVTSATTIGNFNTIRFGASAFSGGSQFLNGTIKQFSFYPRRLSNTELQGITS